MVSGLWASFFSLGAFVGPSVAGILYDTVGFRSGTLFPVGMHVLVVSWQTAKCLHVLAHEGIAFGSSSRLKQRFCTRHKGTQANGGTAPLILNLATIQGVPGGMCQTSGGRSLC